MKWTSAFSYLPINYAVPLAAIKDRTQRVVFDNNLNGNKIRLRFSNKYSKKPLMLTSVTVGMIREGQVRDAAPVCRNQNTVIELGAEEECWSDELAYSVAAGEKIAVSIYIKEQQEIGSACIFWAGNGAAVGISEKGNYASGEAFEGCPMEEVYQIVSEDTNKGTVFYGFCTARPDQTIFPAAEAALVTPGWSGLKKMYLGESRPTPYWYWKESMISCTRFSLGTRKNR